MSLDATGLSQSSPIVVTTDASLRNGRSHKRLVAVLSLVILAALVGGVQWKLHAVAPRRDSLAVVGKTLPHLPVVDFAGKTVDLSTLQPGKKKVIAFYSPTCEVCAKELPELQPFPSNLELIMVKEPNQKKQPPVDPFGLGSNGLKPYEDRNGVLTRSFPMAGLPTLLFVDEHGVLRDGMVGAHPRSATQTRLQQFSRQNYPNSHETTSH